MNDSDNWTLLELCAALGDELGHKDDEAVRLYFPYYGDAYGRVEIYMALVSAAKGLVAELLREYPGYTEPGTGRPFWDVYHEWGGGILVYDAADRIMRDMKATPCHADLDMDEWATAIGRRVYRHLKRTPELDTTITSILTNLGVA